MTGAEVALGVLVMVGAGVLGYWAISLRSHQRRLEQLAVRVHVNGIRGKSTVTRLVAAVLREGGFVTVAKTTGSAARVIGPRGGETEIRRRGSATINEQVDVVRDHVGPDVEALVIECMAVKPIYQEYAQDRMVRSDITVITNVRADHQEEMGETLEEIADAMSRTIPHGGILVTSEARPELRDRLEHNAAARASQLVYADPASVDPAEMAGFDHLQFRENVAIGLAVARIMGIDRETALRGMLGAAPDIGVVRLRHYPIGSKDVLWVPLFAANDRESVLLTLAEIEPQYGPDATVIAILNNRTDRGRRAELFADIAAEELATRIHHFITFGAFEAQVTRRMVRRGLPRERITNLGDTTRPSLPRILAAIEALIPGRDAVLIGMVNIHTPQAELLMEHFEALARRAGGKGMLADQPGRLPLGVGRLRRARAHVRRDASAGDA
jgi:poly-gamma-glutamate synthase PgsB/CapB